MRTRIGLARHRSERQRIEVARRFGLGPLKRMPSQDVRHCMGQQRGRLVIIELKTGEQGRVHGDLSAWQTPCIERRLVEDMNFPGPSGRLRTQCTTCRDQAPGNRTQTRVHRRIVVENPLCRSPSDQPGIGLTCHLLKLRLRNRQFARRHRTDPGRNRQLRALRLAGRHQRHQHDCRQPEH